MPRIVRITRKSSDTISTAPLCRGRAANRWARIRSSALGTRAVAEIDIPDDYTADLVIVERSERRAVQIVLSRIDVGARARSGPCRIARAEQERDAYRDDVVRVQYLI